MNPHKHYTWRQVQRIYSDKTAWKDSVYYGEVGDECQSPSRIYQKILKTSKVFSL